MLKLNRRSAGLVERAKRAAAVLEEHSTAANRTYRMLDETLRAIKPFFKLLIPKQYGGLGADSVGYTRVLAELAKADASPVLYLAMHNFAMSEALRPEVPEEVRARILKLGLTHRFCAMVSEADSTSNIPGSYVPDSLTARQLPDGSWVLNGDKTFVTGYYLSSYALVYAHLEGSEATTICLLVPTKSKGMVEDEGFWERHMDIMCSTRSNPVKFTDVEVEANAEVLRTDNYIRTAVIEGAARTFAYIAAYLGIIMRLLKRTQELTQGRTPKGFVQTMSYHNSVVVSVGRCARLVNAAGLQLDQAMVAFDEQDPNAVMYLMMAKGTLGDAWAKCARDLPISAGARSLGDQLMKRLLKDGLATEIMPPNTPSADSITGHLFMDQFPADAMPPLKPIGW